MRLVALAGIVVLLAACGSEGRSAAPPAATAVTTAPATTGGTGAPGTGPLPALDSPAPVWHYSKATPDPARQAALQTALGGPATVADDAPQSWTFSPASPSAPASGGTDPAEIGRGILTAIGRDPAAMTWTVSADGRTATGAEQLAGVPSPLPFVVTVDGSGRIVAASGHLDPPLSVGDQPRIGTAAALGLLAGANAGDDRGEHQPSLRPDVTPAVPPLSTEPTTQPTVVDNLVGRPVSVAATYVQVPATDGGAWLLAAYRFTFDDGSTRTVLAVPGPPPDRNRATADPSPLVGLTENQAEAAAASHGWAFRVAERDGVSEMLTADYDPDRVNVAVTNGVVTRAWMG
jgi:hypothetical protein